MYMDVYAKFNLILIHKSLKIPSPNSLPILQELIHS